MPYNIILVDDHKLFRQGLKMILSQKPEYKVVGEASDGLELLTILRQNPRTDVVIIDLSIPKIRGIEAMREIKKLDDKIGLLVLTMHNDQNHLREAYQAGAGGYLLKEDLSEELFAALTSVIKGKTYISRLLGEEVKKSWLEMLQQNRDPANVEILTVREKEVVKLLAEGCSNKEVANHLVISVRTVDHHRANIMKKLSLKSAADLVRYAISKGYTSS